MSYELNRRQLLGLGLAGLGTTALAGCVGNSPAPAASKATGLGPFSLEAAWYGGDPVHPAMEKILAQFQKKHPGSKITNQHSAFADYWPKIATETAARNAPDVMRMSMTYFTDYAERGALLELNEFVGTSKAIDVNGLEKGVADSGILNGKRYGVGQSSIANVIFINPEMIDSLGLKLPDENWTWESFANYALSVTAAGGGKIFGTADMSGHFELFEPFSRQHGSNLFTKDGKALAVKQNVIEEWWAYWAKLRDAKGTPGASETASETGFPQNPVVKGLTPISTGWVQQINFLQPLMKQTINEMIPPTVKGGKPGYYVDSQDMWSIASTTKNKEAAAELINFLVNSDQAIKILGVLLGVPPSKHATDLLNLDPTSAAGKAVAYAQNLGKSGKATTPPPPWPKGYSALSTLFGTTAQNISFKKTTPSKAAADFYSQSKQILTQS